MARKPSKRSNGEGTLFFSDAMNRYIGKATMATGKRKTFYGPLGDHSATARLGVQEKMRPYVGRHADGTTTLGDAIREYLESHAHLAPSTIAGYKTAAKHVIGDMENPNPAKRKPADPIARKPLIELQVADIKQFYRRLAPGRADRGQSGSTMRLKVHVLIHAVLQEATESEIITRNPASLVPTPTVEVAEKPIWTPEEMLRFLKAIKGHRLYAMFLLSICTTMGNAELFGLRWSDVRLDAGELTVAQNLVTVEGKVHRGSTKTKKRRRPIALPAVAVSALRERRKVALAEGHASSEYVFTSDRGHPLRGDNFRNRAWKPLLAKAEVPSITPYALRHCAKALMEHLGISLEAASARMGHSTITLTANTYGHLYDREGRAIADRLDKFLEDLA